MNTQQSQQSHQLGITLPITSEHVRIAERFVQLCPFSEKAQQIRHNTLAVCAVNDYLQLMDIPTDITDSDSQKPVMQLMGDVADLKVTDMGSLACRAVMPEDEACYVPPEEWDNRAGYVAVSLNEANHQATLIGFVANVEEQEQIALSQFGPIETLIDRWHHLQQSEVASSEVANSEAASSGVAGAFVAEQTRAALTQLGNWVDDAIAAGWQTVDALINPNELNFAVRNSATLAPQDLNRMQNDESMSGSPDALAANVSRAKSIDLGVHLGHAIRVALVVHITRTSTDMTEILLQVRPLGDSPYLAEGLRLTATDENNNALKVVTAYAIDNYIQMQLTGQPNERFSVHVTLGDATFTEQFVI